MQADTTTRLGDELYDALLHRQAIEPLSGRGLDLDIDAAYAISRRFLARRIEAGERLIGKKIGATSRAVQTMLDVHQPDFGFLTDRMVYDDGAEVPASRLLIQPRAEGEIAFLLKRDLIGPGVTGAEVLRATECLMPCFEIVDSRIRDWRIGIVDTVADNASCGALVIGSGAVKATAVDLVTAGIVMEKNGVLAGTGAGAAALGSPVNCVAWLANTLGRYGIALAAGELVLSGSLVPLVPVAAGDHMTLALGGIGSASVRFT